MKNLFTQLFKKEENLRDKIIAGVRQQKVFYQEAYDFLADYPGQQQKLAKGVIGLERFLMTAPDANVQDPDEILWCARISSLQFVNHYINNWMRLDEKYQVLTAKEKAVHLMEIYEHALDMLIESPSGALRWLQSLSQVPDDFDISTMNIQIASL